jgi:hypothetical protein
MPHATLKLLPGVDQNRTPTFNEASISSCDKIRFQPDQRGVALPQKIGGWIKYYSAALAGIIREMWAWENANASSYLAAGTTQSLFALSNVVNQSGTVNDIYPQYYTVNRTVSFSTTAGSSTVTVNDAGSNIVTGDTVNITTHVSVGGVIFFGAYLCSSVSSGVYQIQSTDVLGYPNPATSNATNTGTVASFAVASGDNAVTVTLADHGFSVGQYYPVLVQTTLGSSGITLYGNYIIQRLDSLNPTNKFIINAANQANAAASSVSINGGLVRFEYYLGNTVSPSASGFAADAYGIGGFGAGAAITDGRSFSLTGISPSTPSAGYVEYSFAGSIEIVPGTLAQITGVTTTTGYNTAGSLPVISSVQGATTTIVLQQSTTGTGTGGTIIFSGFTGDGEVDWTLGNWGEILISCPQGGAIYEWDANSGAQTSSIITAAPQSNTGMFIAMPQRQIVAYGSTFNGIQQPLLVRWCDIGNYNVWAAQIINQAGSYVIPKGSRIVGGIQGPQQSFLWTDLACWVMQYVGQPYIYNFNEIGTGCGLIAKKAAGSLSGSVYWMGPSQFYRLAGNGVEPMSCPVWDVVFQNMNAAYVDNIRFAANSRFGEATWYYPSRNSASGENDSYVKYNALIDKWDYGSLNRSAWLDQSVLGAPIGAAGSGSQGYIYQHESTLQNGIVTPLYNDDISPLTASFRTGYFEISDAEYKMFVDQIWPDMKWGYFNGAQGAQVKITFYVTDYPGEPDRVYGPYTLTNATDFITPRFRGRLVSIEISSDDLNSFWRLGAMRYRVQPDGKF